ncbi:hypothetical protein EDC04DRAFT_2600241 [Pisolithus marmoratus]|nr:hypothetical protein EDC04DRAFT_2600241 [Pisolithus marmoratus]
MEKNTQTLNSLTVVFSRPPTSRKQIQPGGRNLCVVQLRNAAMCMYSGSRGKIEADGSIGALRSHLPGQRTPRSLTVRRRRDARGSMQGMPPIGPDDSNSVRTCWFVGGGDSSIITWRFFGEKESFFRNEKIMLPARDWQIRILPGGSRRVDAVVLTSCLVILTVKKSREHEHGMRAGTVGSRDVWGNHLPRAVETIGVDGNANGGGSSATRLRNVE